MTRILPPVQCSQTLGECEGRCVRGEDAGKCMEHFSRFPHACHPELECPKCYALVQVFGSKLSDVNWLKDELFKTFKMNEVRDCHSFLGFQIVKNELDQSISINQNKFLNDLLNDTEFKRTPKANTPMEAGTTLSLIEAEVTDED